MYFTYQIIGTNDHIMFVFPDNKPVIRAMTATNSVYACDLSRLPDFDRHINKKLSKLEYSGFVACYFYNRATSRDITRRMTVDEIYETGLLEVRPAQELLAEMGI